MENPKITTKIKHSKSKKAWNVIGTKLGCKYKIAIVPYIEIEGSDMLTELQKNEALRHAKYISYCFNNSDEILNN